MSKINLFEDKEYDKLDWLNKAVEPFIFPPNDILAVMPEQVDFDYNTLWELMKEHHQLGLHIETLVQFAAQKHDIELGTTRLMVCEQYTVEVQSDTTFDFEAKTMTGGIRLIKKKSQLTDEDITELLCIKLREKLVYVGTEQDYLPRLNEVLDVIGVKETRNSRSARYKRDEICEALVKVVREDKWRVRNYELMLKTGEWIKAYVEQGNLAAMSNFTRLKCMVHKGAPIYSMEETK